MAMLSFMYYSLSSHKPYQNQIQSPLTLSAWKHSQYWFRKKPQQSEIILLLCIQVVLLWVFGSFVHIL